MRFDPTYFTAIVLSLVNLVLLWKDKQPGSSLTEGFTSRDSILGCFSSSSICVCLKGIIPYGRLPTLGSSFVDVPKGHTLRRLRAQKGWMLARPAFPISSSFSRAQSELLVLFLLHDDSCEEFFLLFSTSPYQRPSPRCF